MHDAYVQFLIGYVCGGNWVTDELLKKIRDMASDFVNENEQNSLRQSRMDKKWRFSVYALLLFLEKLQMELDDEDVEMVTVNLSERRYNKLVAMYAEHGLIVNSN